MTHILDTPAYQQMRPYLLNLRAFAPFCEAVRRLEEGACPFCQINEALNRRFTWDIEGLHGWLNPFGYPGTRVHIIIVPKRHIEHERDMTNEEWMALRLALRWCEKAFDIKGLCFMTRCGDPVLTGMSVQHLHFHVIVPEAEKATMVYLSKSAEALAESEAWLLKWEADYRAGKREYPSPPKPRS